jgi:dihydroorotate dehydrogenase (fumarate)
MNASGCLCSTIDQLKVLDGISSVGAIVGKSSSVTPRSGHQEPRLYMDELGTINSMGIPNSGYEYFLGYYPTKPFIFSVYPFGLDDLGCMLSTIDIHSKNRLVEINLGCPNLASDSISARLDTILHHVTLLSLKNIIIGIKLPTLSHAGKYPEIVAVADILLKHRSIVKFVVCSNAISGVMVDSDTGSMRIVPNDGIGGIGGRYIKPITLGNVYRLGKLLRGQIDIIGCGGCYTGKDVYEYLLCGAKAVQIGSCLMSEGYGCFDRILRELEDILKIKGCRHVEECVGKIKPRL